MQPMKVSENQTQLSNAQLVRSILEKYERSKILEVYFARIDGRLPEIIPPEQRDLYEIELLSIKGFLLGQHPQDTLLLKLFRIMN